VSHSAGSWSSGFSCPGMVLMSKGGRAWRGKVRHTTAALLVPGPFE
jgi:hypothetical protein